jgi:hypothetical protein
MMTWVDAACTFLLLLLNKSYVMLQNGCLNIFITSKTLTMQVIGKIFFRQPTGFGDLCMITRTLRDHFCM